MARKKDSSPLKTSSKVLPSKLNAKSDRIRTSALGPIMIFVALVVLSLATRLYNVDKPAHVCWDETHFGKMASWYLNRTFFFDVHPPLGKMLIALSGHLSGYDGRFPFGEPGQEYQHWTQYVGMRVFCALLGSAIPAFVFLSTKRMTNSLLSASLASMLIVFDNGMVTLTRYILLDPPLLFFISASILGMSMFSFGRGPKLDSNAFSPEWWLWLTWTGISISCAFSVKFVGLFTVALVGLRTAYDIWIILGDVSKPILYFLKHLFARVLCLIVLPVVLYVMFFWIHLSQLNHTGNGDGFYSSSFQSQLIGNSLYNSSWPAQLAYDAEVTIKNNRIGGAYLHSHWHLYPEGVGAMQQQVTTYTHKDSNNKWFVRRGLTDDTQYGDEFVHDGDLIRLEHIVTKRNLHSHFIQAPITKRHNQVTCYGENGIGDANDLWRVQKEQSAGSMEDDKIYTVKTRFRLIHYLSNCALHSHSKQLPSWAYEQLEVTCNPRLHDQNNFWNIEDNYYPRLPNVSFEEYAPSFVEKFIESHAVMLQGNAGLKPKKGEVTSRPWQWPLNYKGQFFSVSNGEKIYLLGNPLVWWTNILIVPLTGIVLVILAIANRLNRQKQIQTKQSQSATYYQEIIETFPDASTWTLIGWTFHYIPFFFMGRVLYFHHYFPALIFSCMLTAMTTDYLFSLSARSLKLTKQSTERRKVELAMVITSTVVYTFAKFIPITFGTRSTSWHAKINGTSVDEAKESDIASLKWLDSWEF